MADSELIDDPQLREELLKFDVTVGKINDKNRDILIKKLNHLRARQRAAEAPPSPGRRQSPGRGKKSPPRRSHAPAAPSFSSSDDDVAPPPTVAESTPQRQQKNLRRRTVDSGLVNGEPKDVSPAAAAAVTAGRTRGTSTANAEPLSVPGTNRRRSAQ